MPEASTIQSICRSLRASRLIKGLSAQEAALKDVEKDSKSMFFQFRDRLIYRNPNTQVTIAPKQRQYQANGFKFPFSKNERANRMIKKPKTNEAQRPMKQAGSEMASGVS